MAFKAKEFDKAKFEPRTADVPVPGMKEWFDGDAVWKVRGLSGNELGRCNELAERNRKTIMDIAAALVKNQSDETGTAIRDLVGLSDDVPQDAARRIEYLMAGSVDPDCPLDRAVQLNMAYPIEFRIITEEIFKLTGLGHVPGKPTPSGKDQTSASI